jgi:chemotaxis regulatin CheY-phosphate phosphatase CheZ
MKTLADLTASKLHADEEEIVRTAADSLLFCEDLGTDPASEQALAELHDLTDRLLESDRLQAETAERLIQEVEACGPFAPVS